MRRKEEAAKHLSTAAVLNKNLLPLYTAALVILTLIKADCWLNENRLGPCICAVYQSEGADTKRHMAQADVWGFLHPHACFHLGLLNWYKKGKSLGDPGQIFWDRALVWLNHACLSRSCIPVLLWFSSGFQEGRTFQAKCLKLLEVYYRSFGGGLLKL